MRCLGRVWQECPHQVRYATKCCFQQHPAFPTLSRNNATNLMNFCVGFRSLRPRGPGVEGMRRTSRRFGTCVRDRLEVKRSRRSPGGEQCRAAPRVLAGDAVHVAPKFSGLWGDSSWVCPGAFWMTTATSGPTLESCSVCRVQVEFAETNYLGERPESRKAAICSWTPSHALHVGTRHAIRVQVSIDKRPGSHAPFDAAHATSGQCSSCPTAVGESLSW